MIPSGIIPPVITPFSADYKLDLPALTRVLAHMLDGGVHGLFMLGTTGEGPSLPYTMRRQVIQRSCEVAADSVPVLVSITDTSFEESLQVAAWAAEAGATALVVAPPYYFNMDQQVLEAYLHRIADAAPLPVLLYNMPGCTKVPIAPATVKACISHPNVVGVKDSSGDMEYLRAVQKVCAAQEGIKLFVGPEALLLESLEAGAHGGVSGGANLYPQLYVELFDAFQKGDLRTARERQQVILNVVEHVYAGAPSSMQVTKGLKAAMAMLEICESDCLPPFDHFPEVDAQRIATFLSHLKLSGI